MYRLADSGTTCLRDPPADAHVTVACRWFCRGLRGEYQVDASVAGADYESEGR
jgi:hypothetical protein